MGNQPILKRPEWLNKAGDEPISPAKIYQYRNALSGKDLSGLKLYKTRYYCSRLHKNAGDSHVDFTQSRGKIGPFKNVPRERWGSDRRKPFGGGMRPPRWIETVREKSYPDRWAPKNAHPYYGIHDVGHVMYGWPTAFHFNNSIWTHKFSQYQLNNKRPAGWAFCERRAAHAALP